MESRENYVSRLTRHQDGVSREKVTSSDVQLDSCGVAARFLRLAFRINMEQLKLVREEELPQLPPLSAEELAEEEREAAAASEEIRAALQGTIDRYDEQHRQALAEQAEQERLKQQEEAERAELAEQLKQLVSNNGRQEPVASDQVPAGEPAAPNVHKLHQSNG